MLFSSCPPPNGNDVLPPPVFDEIIRFLSGLMRIAAKGFVSFSVYAGVTVFEERGRSSRASSALLVSLAIFREALAKSTALDLSQCPAGTAGII
jgi:hypothetical protein